MADSKEAKILNVLLDHIARIIDVDLLYVALFNKVTVELDFPLVARKVDGRLEREVGGRWASRPYQPAQLLPDCILASGKPILIGGDFGGWLAENDLRYPLDESPLSWLGVPMVARGNVIGVIVAENHQREHAYDERTSTILATMADRVASSIANNRLVENLRAVDDVGRSLTSGIRLREAAVLELIYRQASRLMDTRSMYIALYDAEQQMLSFPLAVEGGKLYQYPYPPRKVEVGDKTKGGLTEIVIRTKQPLRIGNVEAWLDRKLTLPIPPIPKSYLGVPMIHEDRVLGIFTLLNDELENIYGQDDQEVLQAMAGQAAIAIDNARLYYDTNQRLAALIEVGQTLNSDIRQRQEDILELVYQQASRLMDTRSMYIALYDTERQMLSFPLAVEGGEREEYPPRKVEVDDETKGGLTEIVLRTKQPLRIGNVEAWCQERNLRLPPMPVPKSWLGVPMMLEGRVLGIFSLQNDELENAYGQGDQEVLQAMAGQAAVAIENARLYDQLERARDREIWAALGEVTAGLIHKMSNSLGLIPSLTERVEKAVGPLDEATATKLRRIREGAQDALSYTAGMARILELRKIDKEEADMRILIGDALRQAIPAPEERNISLETNYAPELPLLCVNAPLVIEALQNIMRNAVEAMPAGGRLSIRLGKADGKGVQIQIADTGCGIPLEKQPNVFRPGFSSKREGKGIGLWFCKTVVDQHQGSISFESQEGLGTTFTIFLPTIGAEVADQGVSHA